MIKCRTAPKPVSGEKLARLDENGKVIIDNLCHQCRLLKQRKARKDREYMAHQWRYEKTVNGVLLRRHQMVGRSLGWRCDRKEFVAWAKSDSVFCAIYQEWRDGGFQRSLAPAVVVLDETKPPSFENCVWITNGLKISIRVREDRSEAPTHRQRRSPSSK